MFIQTVRDKLKELKGSWLVEARPYGALTDYISMGPASSIKTKIIKTTGAVEADNTYPDIELSEEGMEFSATLKQFLTSNTLDVLFGSEGKSVVVGSPATLTQSFIATANYGYEIKAVNASGVAPTITSCKDSTGTNYAAYNVTKVGDRWLIEFDATDTYTVIFSYTPVSSIRYEIGAASTLPYVDVRLTNKNENGTTYIYLYKACNTTGIELDGKKDVTADRANTFAVNLKAFPDANHVAANGNLMFGAIEGPFK